MKRIFILFALMIANMGVYADNFTPSSNILTIPSVLDNGVTYTNVVVNLGSNFQVLAYTPSGTLGGTTPTVDNFVSATNVLTIPFVSVVGDQNYTNVTVQLGANFQVLSVGGCSPCGNSAQPINNVAPLIVDSGPASLSYIADNEAYTSVTICQSGTNNCQTIDHIVVDTGSSGFFVLASALPANFSLPPVTIGSVAVVDCRQLVGGYLWGSIKLADVKIAGEIASNIPIQLISDNAYPVPNDCASTGNSIGDPNSLGANGIIGVGNFIYDCGSLCAGQAIPGTYYSCTSSGCQAVALPVALQTPNPVAFFASDNNGSIIQLPAVSALGGTNVAGSLIFGIGTQSNNGLGSAFVLTLDDVYGEFTTVYKGQNLSNSYFDSGSNALFFNDTSIQSCDPTNLYNVPYCPTQTLDLSASAIGQNGATDVINFSVANGNNLFESPGTAFSNIAYPNNQPGNFAWVLMFFMDVQSTRR